MNFLCVRNKTCKGIEKRVTKERFCARMHLNLFGFGCELRPHAKQEIRVVLLKENVSFQSEGE